MILAWFFDLHVEGGFIFMAPLSVLLAVSVCIVLFIVASLIQKKELSGRWFDAVKQIGGLAAAWGTLATIVGLYGAFQALEVTPEVLPFQVIMGGLKVAVITAIYGLIIFCLSLLAYIILKMVEKKSVVLHD